MTHILLTLIVKTVCLIRQASLVYLKGDPEFQNCQSIFFFKNVLQQGALSLIHFLFEWIVSATEKIQWPLAKLCSLTFTGFNGQVTHCQKLLLRLAGALLSVN